MKRNNLATALALTASFALAGSALAGNVVGTVKYGGPAPAPKKIEKTKDTEVCGKVMNTAEDMLVGTGGGLKNVVVMVQVPNSKPMAPPAKAAVLDQKGCWFVPHIQIIAPGQSVDIVNDDGILHNIHTQSKLNPPFNTPQPKFKKTITKTFEKPEIVKLACDVHNWMSGWLVVAAHPYYALTGADGSFKVPDVPPGTYDVKYWHEKLGEKTGKVTVAATGDAKADFSFPPK